MEIGELPVGRPRTKGLFAVGLKSLILLSNAGYVQVAAQMPECGCVPLADVVGNVVADRGGIVADYETCVIMRQCVLARRAGHRDVRMASERGVACLAGDEESGAGRDRRARTQRARRAGHSL